MNDKLKLNLHREVRMKFAHQISKYYKVFEKVEAIAVSGSTARGGCDEWSDLEIAIFWKIPPTLKVRNEVIEKLDGKVVRQITPETENFFAVDNIEVESMSVDVIHNVSDIFLKLVEDVVMNEDVSFKKQEVVAVANSFLPVYGVEFIQSLREKTKKYTQSYQLRNFNQIIPPRISLLKIYNERGDFVPFNKELILGVESLLKMLCSVNKVYYPGSKRSKWLIEFLELKPINLLERLNEVFCIRDNKSIELLEALSLEVIDICESNLKANLERIREDLYKTRRRKVLLEAVRN